MLFHRFTASLKLTFLALVLTLHSTYAVPSSSGAGAVFSVSVRYPDSNLGPNDALFLRGDGAGLSWSAGFPLKHTDRDLWELQLQVDEGTVGRNISAKVLINDETWQLGRNTAGVVSTTTVFSIFPWFFTPNGRYEVAGSLHSDYFDNNRDVVVYVPPSYDENPYKQYPTLLMHDGQNLFNASTSFGGVAWECQRTVDALVGQERIREMIIVGVYNTAKRMEGMFIYLFLYFVVVVVVFYHIHSHLPVSEYTYSHDPEYGGGDGDQYLDFLEQSVLPFVASSYRVLVDRDHLTIMGSSLGGLISCYAGWTRSSVYSSAGCMSSSFWWNSEDFDQKVLVTPGASPATGGSRFYLDSGNQPAPNGDDELQTVRVREHLAKFGFALDTNLFYYLDDGGAHNEAYWGERFWIPLTYLYS